jgi:flagellar hook-associated protein 1
MSVTSLLSIARGALSAQEQAVNVIGHNIANAETPGYTRQRVSLAAASPETLPPLGQLGRGVTVAGIERLRSAFLDSSWRQEAGLQGRTQTLSDVLSQVTGVLAEPSDTGLGASLDNLIDAFNSLASNPVDPTARAVVAANATALTDKFHSIDAQLNGIAQNVAADLTQAVNDVNSYAGQISDLNTQIRAAGGAAPDLLDRRDQLIDKLGGLIDVRVVDRGVGTVDVLAGGLQLVSSGGTTQSLSVSGSGPYQVRIGSPAAPVSIGGGKIAGLIDAFNTIGVRGSGTVRATGLRGQLDDLAAGLVTAVNQIHSGYDPSTKPLQPTITPAPSPLATIGAFFDPNGITAASIQLDPAIQADPANIAAGYSTAAGDNTIALQLGGLRNLSVPVPGASGATPNSPATAAGGSQILGDFYTSFVAALGVTAQAAQSGADSHTTLLGNLNAKRQSDSGVSIDEEMVSLIEHQQAYTAAARLVKVADEMLQELVNLGR